MTKSRAEREITVICLGNPVRGDDAAGHLVADLLSDAPNIRVIKAHSAAEALHELMSPKQELILVDALEPLSRPGRIHRLRGYHRLSRGAGWRSSHTVDLRELLALAEELGALPEKVTIYGIEGEIFDPGEELSQPVSKACHKVAEEIRRRAGAAASRSSRAKGRAARRSRDRPQRDAK